MKLFFFVALFISVSVFGQNNIYDLDFRTAYGGPLSMSQFRGQKILVASISVENLQKKGVFEFWDSLKTVHPKLAIILIPADDIGTRADSTAMDDIKRDNAINNPSGRILVTDRSEVRKDKNRNQHAIMQWLTDGSKNKHFNAEVESEQQIYVISESGELYAVLARGVRLSVLNDVLRQNDMKPSVLGELKQ